MNWAEALVLINVAWAVAYMVGRYIRRNVVINNRSVHTTFNDAGKVVNNP